MEPIKDITQKEIKEVFDYPIEQTGNKIKLRQSSHENLVRHLQNIPYKAKKGPQIKFSNTNSQKEKAEWTLITKEPMECIEIARKPINVKENMIENIRKHSEITTQIEEKMEVTTEKEPINKIEKEKNNNKIIDFAAVSKQDSDKELDVQNDDTTKIREELLRKKEAVANAQREADESDRKLQELGVEYTEIQKQIQEAKQKYQEALARKEAIEKSQHETMKKNLKKLDVEFDELNKRTKTNQPLINDMELKINNGKEEFKNINNDLARIEEYIRALSFDNDEAHIQFTNEEKAITKRVA